MKKIIVLMLVLSVYCTCSTAMASDGPSILKNMDPNIYQTLSDKQLSEAIGESFIFQILIYGIPIWEYYDSTLLPDQLGFLRYNIGTATVWSYSLTPL